MPSLNVLLTSTAWRNDHNGFSHQGPGLLQVAITQRPEVPRVCLPPDANCLLSVADHCLRSRNYVNLIVIDKQPQLRFRVVNVVDLMALQRPKDHPHGMSDLRFRELFTDSVDVVFAFHGFPGAIHQVVHGRPDADRFHVRGFMEEGTTTTPLDMTVRNRASHYHLVVDALNNARRLPPGAGELMAYCEAQLARHREYVVEHLEDMPEARDWPPGGTTTLA